MNLSLSLKSIKGNSYEIGRKLGEDLFSKNPSFIEDQLIILEKTFLYPALGMKFDLDKIFVNEASAYLKETLLRYDPDLLGEIKGFSEGLRQPLDKTLAFILNYGNGKGCTHIYVNGLHAHNYDDNPNNIDMQFLIIEPSNSYRLAGFSYTQVGRVNGMNEKGLTVSLSWGAGKVGTKIKLNAEIFIRILLDKVENTEQALEYFGKIGFGSPNNLLISDSSGNAVVIENSGKKSAIRKTGLEKMIYCTNRYFSKRMKSEQKYVSPTTFWREKLIESKVNEKISKEELEDLMLKDYPDGLYEPYYKEDLGTLCSMLFQPKNKKIDLMIGEKNYYLRKIISLDNELENFQEVLNVQVKDIKTNDRNYSV